MKALIPILIVATTSLAVASVQFARQASQQRERAEAEAALRLQHEARLAELERLQAELEQQLLVARAEAARPQPEASEKPQEKVVARAGLQAGAANASVGSPRSENAPAWQVLGPRQRPGFDSPAARNVLRARMKQALRRQYEDVGAELGLTEEQQNELLDLLADQQARQLDRPPLSDPQKLQQFFNEDQRRRSEEIAAIIGQDRMDEWAQFQQSLPHRAQVTQIQEQLDASGVPMSASQRKEMLAAISEERQRLVPPVITPGLPPEEMTAQMNQWQADYDRAVLDRARSILSSEQYKSFKEFQDYQAEMRKGFAAFAPPPAVASSGNVVSAAPAGMQGPVLIGAPMFAPMPPPPAQQPGTR